MLDGNQGGGYQPERAYGNTKLANLLFAFELKRRAALNNSAPLVLYWIDVEIARLTGGRRSLDDAVRALAHDGGTLTTASFLRAVNRAAGHDLTPPFRRHVRRGEPPPVGGGTGAADGPEK